MSDNNDNTMPWTVYAAGAPGDTSKVGATLQTFQTLSDAGLTPERHTNALDCDAGIVRNWMVQNLPSGTMDQLRARLLESLPDGAVLVTGVGGTRMFVVPFEGGMVQLYTLAGERFTIPVCAGDAGLDTDPNASS